MANKIVEILTLASRIQSETDRCVFIDLSGHINSLDIKICESRKEYSNRIMELHCCISSGKKEKISPKRQDEIIRMLSKVLKKRKIELDKYRCINDNCPHFTKTDSFSFLYCYKANDLSDLLGCHKHEYR